MAKPGPKETEVAALRLAKFSDIPTKLLRGHPDCVVKDAPRVPKPKPPTNAGVTLAPPLSIQKAIAADLKDEPEPEAKPEANEETDAMTKKPAIKKKAAAKKPAAKKTKKPAKGKSANASTSKAKAADARARSTEKRGVPATEVADFICREGGASMAELEARFNIEAHPMRAKIYRAKHVLGYSIRAKDGRYTGTPPKAK